MEKIRFAIGTVYLKLYYSYLFVELFLFNYIFILASGNQSTFTAAQTPAMLNQVPDNNYLTNQAVATVDSATNQQTVQQPLHQPVQQPENTLSHDPYAQPTQDWQQQQQQQQQQAVTSDIYNASQVHCTKVP